MVNVLQAGSVPIYMGAPNVHPAWTPGENAIVQTDKFQSPTHMAKFLKRACADTREYEKFFEWKKKGLSPQFLEKLAQCAFYGAECRLCKYLLDKRNAMTKVESIS